MAVEPFVSRRQRSPVEGLPEGRRPAFGHARPRTAIIVRAAAEREPWTERERQADDALRRHLSDESSFEPRYDALTDTGLFRQTALRETRLMSPVPEPRADDREVGMERLLTFLRLVWIQLLMEGVGHAGI